MSDWGAGGRQRRYREMGALALALLCAFGAVGCRTAVNVVPPRPCDTLDDRPGLTEELLRLKALPGDPYKRTRWFVLDASESCAGNRALGAARISSAPAQGFWARIWGWF